MILCYISTKWTKTPMSGPLHLMFLLPEVSFLHTSVWLTLILVKRQAFPYIYFPG
jgi:hypothetical protein